MLITKLKGKIHRVTIKQAEFYYVGSITIDEALMETANIVEYEKVQIANIMSYAMYDSNTEKEEKPKVVFVDENNKITRVTEYEKHEQLGNE